MDIYGKALNDFYNNRPHKTLWINNTYGEPEEMPIEVFFRELEEMPEIELLALKKCRGKVLDIGAGAGSHALILQQSGFDVSALELSGTACHIMEKRGVKKVINSNIFEFGGQKFDTLLLLMNGIGLSQTINGLKAFLQHARTLLNQGGQLIFDSSDITYLYDEVEMPADRYFGELEYQYQYDGINGDWFKWLYVDKDTLIKIAREQNWQCEILLEDDYSQYLAQLKL